MGRSRAVVASSAWGYLENAAPKIPPTIATKNVPRTNRMINAGIDAIAHLTMNPTMLPKGIVMSTILTLTMLLRSAPETSSVMVSSDASEVSASFGVGKGSWQL